jgi:hypothetical protein
MRPGAEAFRVSSTTGPWTSEDWQGELEALTRHVRLSFARATSRFAPPSEEGCRYFANCLLTYFLPTGKRTVESPKEKVVKHGRILLKHLEVERRSIERLNRVSSAFNFDGARQEADITLFHMDEAKRHLECLFNRLSSKRSPKNDWIRWLADLAQELWKETNGGQAPRSKKAEGPFCRLLLPVLKAIHLNPSPATIEAALRGLFGAP